MPGTEQAARYREIRRLGAGGMAKVTLAEDTVLGREVALKRVYATGDSQGILRLKREALVGASLNHPNLVFVYDAHLEEDGDVVIVMEYVEGNTLADVISARGALPPEEAMRVLAGVAAALDAIHEQGIVHRDVKPANVLLGRDGAIKLADLGVADVADRTRITSSGAVVGSFSYMAAEQLEGAAASPAVDIYALAAVAFEMLTGEKARPESNPLALAHAISTQPPPDLRKAWPAAPAEATAVLQAGMSADPAMRPGSAGELVRRLGSALAPKHATEAAPAADRPRLRPARPPRSIAVPALLAVAAVVVAGVVVAILSGGGGGGGAGGGAGGGGGSRGGAAKKQAGTTTTAHRSSQQPSTTTSAVSTAAATSTPAAAVEQFYTAAASHQYPQAWALADQNLRNELGGYAAFQNLMSSVRSITFHRADVVSGASSNTATVALQTTSVQTDRTQQCTGTARTVRAGAGWLVDGVSISCS
jgi:eukaryotic-like serine/threonine-protein kinase